VTARDSTVVRPGEDRTCVSKRSINTTRPSEYDLEVRIDELKLAIYRTLSRKKKGSKQRSQDERSSGAIDQQSSKRDERLLWARTKKCKERRGVVIKTGGNSSNVERIRKGSRLEV